MREEQLLRLEGSILAKLSVRKLIPQISNKLRPKTINLFMQKETKTNEYISDPISGVGGYNLIKIARKVEVLEWRHKTKKEDNR